MSRIAKLRQIARITRDHKDVYRGPSDVAKTFMLRYATTHKQVAGALGWLKTISLRIDGLPGRVHVRITGSDFLVLREIFELGEYAAAKEWTLPRDARVIDLGGNIGLASVFFTGLAPDASFVVVEPDRENCRMIERNCRRMVDAGRMQIAQAFVAKDDGVAGLDRSWRAWAFHKVDTIDASHEAVQCFSMESLIKLSGFDRIDVLKCDVEGTEKELFPNCKNWIGMVNHLIVETHMPYQVSDLYADLRAAGWDFEITEQRQDGTHGICFLKRKS